MRTLQWQIWEEVKANIEGHLDIHVREIGSNGIDVGIIMDDVPYDWLSECVSGVEELLGAALVKFHQPQIPACIDITVTREDDAETIDSLDITSPIILMMKFMLIVKPPTENAN